MTHLAVGAGLVLGAVVNMVGLLKNSNTALIVGELAMLVSFAGLTVLEGWSVWTPPATV